MDVIYFHVRTLMNRKVDWIEVYYVTYSTHPLRPKGLKLNIHIRRKLGNVYTLQNVNIVTIIELFMERTDRFTSGISR